MTDPVPTTTPAEPATTAATPPAEPAANAQSRATPPKRTFENCMVAYPAITRLWSRPMASRAEVTAPSCQAGM